MDCRRSSPFRCRFVCCPCTVSPRCRCLCHQDSGFSDHSRLVGFQNDACSVRFLASAPTSLLIVGDTCFRTFQPSIAYNFEGDDVHMQPTETYSVEVGEFHQSEVTAQRFYQEAGADLLITTYAPDVHRVDVLRPRELTIYRHVSEADQYGQRLTTLHVLDHGPLQLSWLGNQS